MRKNINFNLAECLVKKAIELGLHIHVCGSNGGDAVYYMVKLGPDVELWFTNHDYLDFGVNLYNDESDGLYAPKIEVIDK